MSDATDQAKKLFSSIPAGTQFHRVEESPNSFPGVHVCLAGGRILFMEAHPDVPEGALRLLVEAPQLLTTLCNEVETARLQIDDLDFRLVALQGAHENACASLRLARNLLPADQHVPLGERIRAVLDRLAAAEGDRDALRTLAQAAEARMEVMSGLLVDLRDYVARSDGIAGYHLNGDLAPWDETGLTVEAIDAAVAADAARPHLTRAFTAEAERDALLAKCQGLEFQAVKAEAVATELRAACTQASAFLASCNGLPDAAGDLRHVLWKAIALKVENPLLEDALVKSDAQPKQPAPLTPRQAQIIRDLFYKNCEDFPSAVEWAGFKDSSEVEDAFDALEGIAEGDET